MDGDELRAIRECRLDLDVVNHLRHSFHDLRARYNMGGRLHEIGDTPAVARSFDDDHHHPDPTPLLYRAAELGLPSFSLPAEYGLSWLLPRLIGLARANDILFTSRVVMSEEATAIGLTSEPLRQFALEYLARWRPGGEA